MSRHATPPRLNHADSLATLGSPSNRPGSCLGAIDAVEPRSVVEIFEPSRGGVPEHVALLAEGLVSRGWQVTVVGPEKAPVMARLAAAGARLVPLRIAHQPHPRDILSVRALLKACGGNPSIIH